LVLEQPYKQKLEPELVPVLEQQLAEEQLDCSTMAEEQLAGKSGALP
jgi:hypothetical protein